MSPFYVNLIFNHQEDKIVKIKYYGTGTSGAIPEMFCSCRVCEYARTHRGKDIRSRSQATVGDLMIDYSHDAFMHTVYGGLDMRDYRHVLITHAHFDHYAKEQMTGRYITEQNWTYYMPPQTAAAERERLAKSVAGGKGNPPRRCPDICDAVPFEPMMIAGYRVTPLPARHAPSIGAVIYLIEKDGKAILWDHDSGPMLPETIEYLRGLDVHLDFVSLDCNLARGENISPYHMDILQANDTANLLREMGRADERTRFVISHISHLQNRTHDELCREGMEFGFETAYDGMEIEI